MAANTTSLAVSHRPYRVPMSSSHSVRCRRARTTPLRMRAPTDSTASCEKTGMATRSRRASDVTSGADAARQNTVSKPTRPPVHRAVARRCSAWAPSARLRPSTAAALWLTSPPVTIAPPTRAVASTRDHCRPSGRWQIPHRPTSRRIRRPRAAQAYPEDVGH